MSRSLGNFDVALVGDGALDRGQRAGLEVDDANNGASADVISDVPFDLSEFLIILAFGAHDGLDVAVVLEQGVRVLGVGG